MQYIVKPWHYSTGKSPQTVKLSKNIVKNCENLVEMRYLIFFK